MRWTKTFLVAGIMAVTSVANAADVAPGDVVFEDGMVSVSLSGVAGNAETGAKTLANRKLGNCLACHVVDAMSNQPFHGNVGPELNGVADRWSEQELRAIVADAKLVFGEQTVMPGFYSLNVGVDVRKDLVGKTLLSAQDIEDVVAYLITLRE